MTRSEHSEHWPPLHDSSGQGYLFPIESPLPGAVADGGEAEKELFDAAYEYAKSWIRSPLGTSAEFISDLMDQFGFGIRLWIADLVARLSGDTDLNRLDKEYLQTQLSVEQLGAVLRGREKIRTPPDSTLDELFAQSIRQRKSEKFIEAVNFVAKLRDYAPYNNMLVYLQRPTATFWATVRDWRDRFERSIKDDAIPIIILQPMGPIMLVFDVVDTDGPDLPERYTEAFDVRGDFELQWLTKTIENCERVHIEVNTKSLGMLHAGTAIRYGTSDSSKLAIEIKEELGVPARYATLCHELAHIFLGHLGGDSDGNWPSRWGLRHTQRELEAEATAYLVCKRAGLTTTSADYLAGYLANPDDLKGISVDMIMKVSGHIERMGREAVQPKKKRTRKT